MLIFIIISIDCARWILDVVVHNAVDYILLDASKMEGHNDRLDKCRNYRKCELQYK